MPEKHKHKFPRKPSWTRGRKSHKAEVGFRCKVKGCSEQRTRPMTKAEFRAWKTKWKKEERESDQMHKVWRLFSDKVKGMDEWGSGVQNDKLKIMDAAYKLQQKYPDDIFVCGIDDTHHTSSDFIMILHRIKRRLWGTTVVVVTQCDPQPPFEFFMYPGHASGIQLILEHLGRFADIDPTRASMIRRIMKKNKKFAKIMNRKPKLPKMPTERK